MSKTQFSSRELKTAFRCGMQYWYRWVEGIKIMPTFAQAAGQGAKAAVKKALEQHADVDSNGAEAGELGVYANQEVNAIFRDGFRDPYGLDEVAVLSEQVSAMKRAGGAVRSFVEHILPQTPRAITPEQGYRVDIPGLATLTGTFAALCEEVGAPMHTRFFYKQAAFEHELMADPMLVLDSYVASVLYDEKEYEVGGGVVMLADIRPGGSDLEKLEPSADDHEKMLDRVETHVKAINAGCFIPAPHDSWTCTNEYCGYYADVCPHGRRNKTQG